MKLKFLIVLVVLGLGVIHTIDKVHSKVYKGAFSYICSLVESRFYVWSSDLEDWGDRCRERASSRAPMISSFRQFYAAMTEQMNEIGVSHLAVYGPIDEKLIWSGVSLDTGIRVRSIDGHLVVHRIISESAAADAGIMLGDEIIRVGKMPVTHMGQIESGKGWFSILRGKKRVEVLLRPRELKIDLEPQLTRLSESVGRLAISSFRGEYFEKKSWLRIVDNLSTYQSLVVDLRGNYGGNFGAVVRALSPFFCGKVRVGELYQPRRDGWGKSEFLDTLDSIEHLNQLESYSNLELFTFSNYGCYAGPLMVLIDEETSSVAEIFAEVIQSEQRGKVWGAGSAGDVVVGVFYELPMLGLNKSISIPEAIFRSQRGHIIEGEGVAPDRWLYYELSEALNGSDSWILKALSESW